ncbi:4Fe-4S dicluster domain-containing protein [Rhizobium deserti]|uniref:4Fe-4S dicluster domain-containing protein n=1 Tax=Rhizobium deserti TaxID=2547961 RepID=A0A4R5UJ35_9HYPH|nr:4Fe-4S dicluster domain-containing protein [Rhizobium deserti]TDK36749.1 4Fe-4S dicluster domain-containing protein [Rhizobium deserti]
MNVPLAIAEQVAQALEPTGIRVRGIVNFGQGEGPRLEDGSPAQSVVLLGNIGGSIWPAFSAWRRSYQGRDPLDTWSKAMILPVARRMHAAAYFPSDMPWHPFQQWAMRAEGLKASPLGMLIHPAHGLWQGYRGALGLPFELPGPPAAPTHPCDGCLDKPCLSACPANALGADRFDVAACRSFLDTQSVDHACMGSGCLARNACPLGASFRYPQAQLCFHMASLKT